MGAGSLAHGDRHPAANGPAVLRSWSATHRAELALAGLIVLGAAVRFYGLSAQGFWFDEANTALLVHLSPGKMLGLLPQTESTPPLYYLVAWVWSRIFGSAEGGLRSLSAAAGVLVIPVAYATARALISRRAAIIAAALTACGPLLVWYSQEARSYELLVLLTGIALLACVHAVRAPSPRALSAWVLSASLALATHYYAILAIVPQAAWLLSVRFRHRGTRAAVCVVTLCGLALIPLAISQDATRNAAWIGSSPVAERLRQVVPLFVIGTGSPLHAVLEPLAALGAAVAIALLLARGSGAERRGPLIAGALAAGGLVLEFALVAAGVDDLIARNLMALWLPAALLVAGGLALPRAGRLGVALAVGLCAITLTADIGVAAEPSLQRPDWRPVAHALGPLQVNGSARVILIQHYRTLLPLSLYLPHLEVMGRTAAVRELDVIAIRSPQEVLCWWGAACNLIPSAVQARYPVPGLHRIAVRRIAQFTIVRLAAARPVRITRAEVARALSATRLHRDALLMQRP